jgi:hypothetical protein
MSITLGHIETAFLGSEYFPVRGTGNVVWATQEVDGESVIRAAVRLREGAIAVEQVGAGAVARKHAMRVARLFEETKGSAHGGLWTIFVRGVRQPMRAHASSEDEAIRLWKKQTKSRIGRAEIAAKPEVES